MKKSTYKSISKEKDIKIPVMKPNLSVEEQLNFKKKQERKTILPKNLFENTFGKSKTKP